MLVLTFQKKPIADMIKSGMYHVDLGKSPYAYSSLRFTIGYNKILNTLRSKGVSLEQNEGCLWGWVSNPSREVISMYLRKGYVAMYIDIDPSKCVMSEYDTFTDYVFGDSTNKDFIVDKSKGSKHCVQCSFTVDSIYSVREIYNKSFLIVYNNIVRSFYTMQTLEGIRPVVVFPSERKNRSIWHRVVYSYEKYKYALRKVYYNLYYRLRRELGGLLLANR